MLIVFVYLKRFKYKLYVFYSFDIYKLNYMIKIKILKIFINQNRFKRIKNF